MRMSVKTLQQCSTAKKSVRFLLSCAVLVTSQQSTIKDMTVVHGTQLGQHWPWPLRVWATPTPLGRGQVVHGDILHELTRPKRTSHARFHFMTQRDREASPSSQGLGCGSLLNKRYCRFSTGTCFQTAELQESNKPSMVATAAYHKKGGEGWNNHPTKNCRNCMWQNLA